MLLNNGCCGVTTLVGRLVANNPTIVGALNTAGAACFNSLESTQSVDTSLKSAIDLRRLLLSKFRPGDITEVLEMFKHSLTAKRIFLNTCLSISAALILSTSVSVEIVIGRS